MASLRIPLVRRAFQIAAGAPRLSSRNLRTVLPFSTTSAAFVANATVGLRSPTAQDIVAFREMLGQKPGSVLTELDDIERYNTDWTKHYKGSTSIVLRPQSTAEVSSILKYCNDNFIGVVPQAGNTGLVGGSIPLASKSETAASEVILSIEKMNQIISWDPTLSLITGQAGGILQDWQDYAREKGVIIPVDLGSKGSCCIGGTVSTNAGGQYYARYKSLHANVVGLEVVLAGGQILQLNLQEQSDNNGSSVLCNLKDNTGYDLKHLFIGAEGTLGIITKVTLWCSSAYPTSRWAALCACTSLEQVQECLPLARRVLGETLAAFEFMDQSVAQLVAARKVNGSAMMPKQLAATDDDDGGLYPYYILVETHGTNTKHDEEKMSQFLEAAMDAEIVLDGVLAQDLTQVKAMWEVRESCNPTVASYGYTYKYDVSLPMAEFGSFAEEMKEQLKDVSDQTILTSNWGHIMDGNLHFNVTTPGRFEKDPAILGALEPYIFESVIRRGGSISAEHGLGQQKHKYLPMIHDAGP